MASVPIPRRIQLSLGLPLIAGALVLGSCEGTTSGTETGSQISLQGRVLDKDNAPVAGVAVRLAKTALADTTDFQGRYHLLKDTAVQTRPGVLDTMVFLQDSQKVAELEVTRWVDSMPDVKLVQRGVSGQFTIVDPGVVRVEAVMSGTGIPQGGPVIAEFFYNRPMNGYSGFIYFPPGGSESVYKVTIDVYDAGGFLIGRSDSLFFNGLAGDIIIPAFDPGNMRPSGWTSMSSGATENFHSVHFADANRGWAVGTTNIILNTVDGGMTWAIQSPYRPQSYLGAVQFIGADTGWTMDETGRLFKTTDGGANWVENNIPDYIPSWPTNSSQFNFHFANTNTGWAVADAGNIDKTADGGISWATQNSGTTDDFASVHFFDARTGWAAGRQGVIARTTDGGAVWAAQNIADTNLRCVHFADANIGMVVGDFGFMARTTDGGLTWTRIRATASDLYSVRFLNADTAWVAGDPGIILATVDGGMTWARQNSGTTRRLRSIYFVDGNAGWVAGDRGTILKTVTGGRSP